MTKAKQKGLPEISFIHYFTCLSLFADILQLELEQFKYTTRSFQTVIQL